MGKVKMPRRRASTNFFDQNMEYGKYKSKVEIVDSLDGSDKEQKISRPTGSRRGRGPAKNPCLNRNALMARENRQRKKEYLQKIENKLVHLQTENQDLKLAIQRQGQENQKLKVEVNHLRAVMTNSTTVTKLLKAISESLVNGIQNSPAALTERLNMNEDNTPDTKPISYDRLNSTMSCGASSTSNEENSDPLYDQGEELITKLASLVEEPDEADENDCILEKKYRYSDQTFNWDKDDVLTTQSSVETSNQDLPDWTDKRLNNMLPLSTDKSEFMADDFNVDSLFENLNDSTTDDPLDQTQMDSTFNETPYDENLNNSLLPTIGICIHVNKNKVSLEFCAECYARGRNSIEEKLNDGE